MATIAHHGKYQFFTVEGPGWPPHTTSRALYFCAWAISTRDEVSTGAAGGGTIALRGIPAAIPTPRAFSRVLYFGGGNGVQAPNHAAFNRPLPAVPAQSGLESPRAVSIYFRWQWWQVLKDSIGRTS